MNKISWQDIYRSEAPKLLALCRRYVKDIATAQDLMQDAFMIAMEKQQQFSGRGAIGAWLRKITVNHTLMHLRKQKHFTELLNEEAKIAANTEKDGDIEDPKSIILSMNLEVSDLIAVIDELAEHHKAVFNLYVFEEYTHKKIAEELSISVGTSKSHLSRARKKIQQILLEKVQEMKKKKRRAVFSWLPFIKTEKAEASYIDDLFSDKLQDWTLETGKMPDKLIEAMNTAPPIQVNPIIGMIKTIGIPSVMIGVIGVSIGVYFFNVDSPNNIQEESKTTIHNVSLEEEIAKEPSLKQESLPISIDSLKPLQNTPKEPVSKIKQKSHRPPSKPKRVSPDQALPPKDTSAPVIIKKQVIVRDTVYQIKPKK